jgi:hypothetical protein
MFAKQIGRWLRTRVRDAREILPERGFEYRLILNARFRRILLREISDGVIIGSSNSANQATAWTRALNRNRIDIREDAKSISIRTSGEDSHSWFSVDYEIMTAQRNDLAFRENLLTTIFLPKQAVLIESMRPYFAFRKRKLGFATKFAIDDLLLLRRMGKKVGFIFHGSDIRDPLAHAARNPYSPFISQDPKIQEAIDDLNKRSQINRDLLPRVQALRIPTFVTTPDLFHEVPEAAWLPAVIDVASFNEVALTSPLFTSEKLRVLYIPSRSWIKSAHLITPVLEKLHGEGLIEWTNWIENGAVSHDQIPQLLAQSDIVIDQFIGLFGVFALEAVAAGRIVLTYVDDAHSHHPTPPHINVTPLTLESEIRRVARDRELTKIRAQRIGGSGGIGAEPVLTFTEVSLEEGLQAGRDFVSFYHDGDYSADVIRDTLGIE